MSSQRGRDRPSPPMKNSTGNSGQLRSQTMDSKDGNISSKDHSINQSLTSFHSLNSNQDLGENEQEEFHSFDYSTMFKTIKESFSQHAEKYNLKAILSGPEFAAQPPGDSNSYQSQKNFQSFSSPAAELEDGLFYGIKNEQQSNERLNESIVLKTQQVHAGNGDFTANRHSESTRQSDFISFCIDEQKGKLGSSFILDNQNGSDQQPIDSKLQKRNSTWLIKKPSNQSNLSEPLLSKEITIHSPSNHHQHPPRGKTLEEIRLMLNQSNNNNNNINEIAISKSQQIIPSSITPSKANQVNLAVSDTFSQSGRLRLSKKKNQFTFNEDYLNRSCISNSKGEMQVGGNDISSGSAAAGAGAKLKLGQDQLNKQVVISTQMQAFTYFETIETDRVRPIGRNQSNRLIIRKKDDFSERRPLTAQQKGRWTMNLALLINMVLERQPRLQYLLYLSHLIGVIVRGFSYFLLSVICLRNIDFLSLFGPLIISARLYYAASMFYVLFYSEQKSESFRSISKIFNQGFNSIDSGGEQKTQYHPLISERIDQMSQQKDTKEQRRAKIKFIVCPAEFNYITLTKIDNRKRGKLFVISNFIYQGIESVLLNPAILYFSYSNSDRYLSKLEMFGFVVDFLKISQLIIICALFIFFAFCLHLLIYGNRKFARSR